MKKRQLPLKTNNAGGESVSPIKKKTEAGRNDQCPCGSGKKYKNCCGKTA